MARKTNISTETRPADAWTTGVNKVQEEELRIRDQIMAGDAYARRFFYKTMRPAFSAILSKLRTDHNIVLTLQLVSTIVYLECWNNNWEKLRAFRGETTIFSWVSHIASQAVYAYLVEEKYIEDIVACRPSNYRLTLRSLDTDLRRAVIDLIADKTLHSLLIMAYMWQLDDYEMGWCYGNYEKAVGLLKRAENTLITVLINTENPYADIAVSCRRRVHNNAPLQPWHDREDEDDFPNRTELHRFLSLLNGGELDMSKNTRVFVDRVLATLKWDGRHRDIWNERFFNNTPSKVLAARYNMRPSCIDNIYSRLSKQFRAVVKNLKNDLI